MALSLLASLLLLAGPARVENPAFPLPVGGASAGPVLEGAHLAPYFEQGDFVEARAAFERRLYARCRQLIPESEASPPARFLRALAAERLGDWAATATEFAALSEAYEAMRPQCLVHAGQAFERLSRWAEAESVFRAADGALPEAQLGLGRVLRRLERNEDAVAAVATLAERRAPPWGRDFGAEALWVQADALAAAKRREEARARLLTLWATHPLSPEARLAGERLRDGTPTPDDVILERAEALLDAQRPVDTIAVAARYALPAKLPQAIACRAMAAVGRAQSRLRQHARAVAALAPVVRVCVDREVRLKALYALGTSQAIVSPALAAGTFAQLAQEAEDGPLADDALRLSAEAHEKQGERDRARERLLELADRFPTSSLTADGLFRLFWMAREDGRPEEGLPFLEEIEGRFAHADDSFDVERARYWRGRALESLTRFDEAVDVYEALGREHPTTYYGLIARERVEALDTLRGAKLATETSAAVETADPFPLPLGALAQDSRFRGAVELLRLGFGAAVPSEIVAIDRSKLGREQIQLLILLLARSKETRATLSLARLWLRAELSGPITRERRALWEAAYPVALRDIVERRAREADGLDPDLLQALMREESSLDVRAVSGAGALGLCQLMPATAAEVAAKLRLARPSAAGLFEPDLNIRLGGRYLADLLSRARGLSQFALAGYNAGESAVARWRKQFGDEDIAAWVEQIPVLETRGYVRRVLRSYAAYKLLNDPTNIPRTVVPLNAKRPKS